jgi:hypothetical protein
MFGRFVSEEIFEKKKKKPCIESEAKHMKLGRKKKKINVTCIWEQEF